MFIHNFKYALKSLFRNRSLIFWTFAFPIVLGTFFNMAFSNIENSEKMDIIDLAVVKNDDFNNNIALTEAFKVLSDKDNDERLFETKYVSEEEAKKLLEEEKVSGYILMNGEIPTVYVQSTGINETIIKYVTEEIIETNEIVTNITTSEVGKSMASGKMVDPNEIAAEVLARVNSETANIKDNSKSNLSYTLIEFYTLIAMTCLYGGILATHVINNSLANMSNKGKRIAVSPISKGKIITSSVLASYVTQIVGLAILFAYTIFVLGVNYGDNLLLIITLALTGSLAGLALGLMIGTVIKANEDFKTGVIISVTMLGCFLSGMMGITMKYIIDVSAPIVNKLNPASMITDGFYSIYYYDTFGRYYFNVISLVVFAVILIFIAYLSLRRQKYDSI